MPTLYLGVVGVWAWGFAGIAALAVLALVASVCRKERRVLTCMVLLVPSSVVLDAGGPEPTGELNSMTALVVDGVSLSSMAGNGTQLNCRLRTGARRAY